MTSHLILFANDWERINATHHLETTNRSFLHMARLLKSMGIRNHMFFLALIDKRLKEVDPFSPHITQEEIAMVAREIYINPWYFFREVARAPAQAGAPARMLQANRGNISLFWCFFNHVMSLLIQIRQTGKSFNADILATGLMQIWCRNTQINLLTKDEKLRRANIQRLKDIMAALPRYLDHRTKKDTDNNETITVREHGNYYYSHLPQSSEAAANSVARGLSSPVFFCDEPPFQPNIHEALPAALGGIGAVREIAEQAGQPYGTVLTTTAGKKDTKEGAFIYKLMTGMAPWTEAFYDAKDQEDLYRMIMANGRDKEVRVNITLNHTQMGHDDTWLKRKISETVADADKADRDFFNRWTSGTASNPLSIEQLERIRASEQESLFKEISPTGGYITWWHLPEHEIDAHMRSEKTLVVFDTSDASGGDDISMRVTNVRTGQLYATATINHTNIITFSEWVATWLTRWENTTMLIERKSTGVAVLDMLLLILPSKNIDPFKRLFNRAVNNPEEYKEVWQMVKEPMWRRPSDFYDMNKKLFGFATSGSGMFSRAELYGQVLHSAANTVGHLVRDKTTIDQISSLITKNGRVNHPAGEHDDLVISWVLTHWFLTKATNLRHYDIDSATILQDVSQRKDVSPVEQLKIKQQQLLRLRAKDLAELMKNAQDDTILRMHEQEMRMIYSRLEERDNERLSVDDLITSIREERIRKRTARHIGGDKAASTEVYAQRAHRMRANPHQAFHSGLNNGRTNYSTKFF